MGERIVELEDALKAVPAAALKAEKKAIEKRDKKMKKHLKKYLGVLNTEARYIEDLLEI